MISWWCTVTTSPTVESTSVKLSNSREELQHRYNINSIEVGELAQPLKGTNIYIKPLKLLLLYVQLYSQNIIKSWLKFHKNYIHIKWYIIIFKLLFIKAHMYTSL